MDEEAELEAIREGTRAVLEGTAAEARTLRDRRDARASLVNALEKEKEELEAMLVHRRRYSSSSSNNAPLVSTSPEGAFFDRDVRGTTMETSSSPKQQHHHRYPSACSPTPFREERSDGNVADCASVDCSDAGSKSGTSAQMSISGSSYISTDLSSTMTSFTTAESAAAAAAVSASEKTATLRRTLLEKQQRYESEILDLDTTLSDLMTAEESLRRNVQYQEEKTVSLREQIARANERRDVQNRARRRDLDNIRREAESLVIRIREKRFDVRSKRLEIEERDRVHAMLKQQLKDVRVEIQEQRSLLNNKSLPLSSAPLSDIGQDKKDDSSE